MCVCSRGVSGVVQAVTLEKNISYLDYLKTQRTLLYGIGSYETCSKIYLVHKGGSEGADLKIMVDQCTTCKTILAPNLANILTNCDIDVPWIPTWRALYESCKFKGPRDSAKLFEDLNCTHVNGGQWRSLHSSASNSTIGLKGRQLFGVHCSLSDSWYMVVQLLLNGVPPKKVFACNGPPSDSDESMW
jgi:hypothetical protein